MGDGDRLPNRKFWGGDGEDIFGEYRGPIGNGDKLEIGEFLGKIPRNSPKIGVGMGKTFLGNIGDQLGTGTNLLLGNFGEFSPKIPRKPGWGRGRHFRGYAPLYTVPHFKAPVNGKVKPRGPEPKKIQESRP